MKRILLMLALVCLASCKKAEDSIVISRDEYNQLKNKEVNPYPKPITFQYSDDLNGESGIILGSDGHEYLSSYDRSERTLTHYVDCELCTQRRIDFENIIIGELIKLKKDTIK